MARSDELDQPFLDFLEDGALPFKVVVGGVVHTEAPVAGHDFFVDGQAYDAASRKLLGVCGLAGAGVTREEIHEGLGRCHAATR
ncbi:hypothetical protein GCM10010485_17090 [Streptosporangium carneum]